MELNQRAATLFDHMAERASELRIAPHTLYGGAKLLDCGVEVPGGLEAGRLLAEVCLAGLGSVSFVPANAELTNGVAVMVRTDHPANACMASQFAGWKLAHGKFFAMGSGPMRAVAGEEAVFVKLPDLGQSSSVVVGVLECRVFPPREIIDQIAIKCRTTPDQIRLLVAPTASLAGAVQVVARSVETALHKLFELGFDLTRVANAVGTAPLPPPAADDFSAIGRTNDSILYGAEVALWVTGDDASLETIGPKTPSGASVDHGQRFAVIFDRYERDFYRIDPLLFSPAAITFHNLQTGSSFRFGHLLPRVIHESFDLRQIG